MSEELNINSNSSLKVAIYAICKNELQFVSKWINSMLEADYICVLDTGSTDGTYEALRRWQSLYPKKIIFDQKEIKPWRFDVARNESIKLIPSDANICWCTDLDEILIPGWADAVKQAWKPNTKQGWYLYAWSHHPDGSPARTFWYNKIHSNDPAWQWKSPVHEGLVYNGSAYNIKAEETIFLDRNRIFLHHYPDFSKSRNSYFPLLKMRAQEEANDFYGCLYLLHQYLFEGEKYYEEGIEYGLNHMVPLAYLCPEARDKGSDILRADMFYFIGQMMYSANKIEDSERMFRLGITSDPKFRENYIALANMLADTERNEEALELINTMFKVTQRRHSWVETDDVWTWKPYDILSRIYYNLRNIYDSKANIDIAVSMAPQNQRLLNNQKIIHEAYSKLVNGN